MKKISFKKVNKTKNYMFTNRHHSRRGIISTILAGIAIIAIIALAIFSSKVSGNGGILYGGIGLCAYIISITGLILGIQSLKEEEIYYTIPRIGAILNTITVVVYGIIYIMGVIL